MPINPLPEADEPLEVPFSTADAEAPVLYYDRGSLAVRFRDWRERTVHLLFDDVAAFSWDEGDAAGSLDRRDDACYVVAGSAWLARHVAAGTIEAEAGHRHFKFCFNVAGVLQVIATRLDLEGGSS